MKILSIESWKHIPSYLFGEAHYIIEVHYLVTPEEYQKYNKNKTEWLKTAT